MINLNQQGSCTTDAKGSGLDQCVAAYGDLLGIDLYQKGFKLLTASEDLPTEAVYKGYIQGETIYPLNDIFDFDQTTPDNENSTSSIGIKKELRAGKPEFTMTWSNGGCFHGRVFDKKGFRRWDVALKFEKGVLYAHDIAESQISAFNMGMFSVGTYKFQQGGDVDMTVANFQIVDAEQFNKRQSFHTWEELGYDMNNIAGVLDANVSISTAPADGVATFSVKVAASCNSSVAVTGLADPNEWNLGGTQASATAISAIVYNASTGAYDFTVDTALASGDTIQPTLADVADGYNVAENTAGDYYKGKSPLTTVA